MIDLDDVAAENKTNGELERLCNEVMDEYGMSFGGVYIDFAKDVAKRWEGFQAGLSAKQEWISVKDRLPAKNTDCIVYMPSRGSVMVCKYYDSWSIVIMPEFCEPLVTHWQPLPPPPKEE